MLLINPGIITITVLGGLASWRLVYLKLKKNKKFTKSEKEIVRICAKALSKSSNSNEVIVYKTRRRHFYVISNESFFKLISDKELFRDTNTGMIRLYLEVKFKPFRTPVITCPEELKYHVGISSASKLTFNNL